MVNGVRNWLCFPVIEKDGKYLVSRIDLAKTIEPQFRPHLISNLRPLKTVVIDAGHGGVEKGAASSYGNEKEFTLDIAQRLKRMLEAKGLRVVMTRTGDDLVPLPLRARIANATRDSIFVSIHFNATDRNPRRDRFRDLLAHSARRALHAGQFISRRASRTCRPAARSMPPASFSPPPSIIPCSATCRSLIAG